MTAHFERSYLPPSVLCHLSTNRTTAPSQREVHRSGHPESPAETALKSLGLSLKALRKQPAEDRLGILRTALLQAAIPYLSEPYRPEDHLPFVKLLQSYSTAREALVLMR